MGNFVSKLFSFNKTRKSILILLGIYALIKYKRYRLKLRIKCAKYQPNIAIIGAGFSGICIAIKLKTELGYNNFTIYDKQDGIGGTWYVNTYPGCQCDVDGVTYSYSFEPKYDWTQAYPPQSETLEYLRQLCDKYNLYSHIKFNHDIVRMEYNENKCEWNIKALYNNNIINIKSNIVFSGVGILNIPKIPNFKGINTFKGKMLHSSQWDHTYNYNNKNIAVIGAGPSAIQIIPEMGKIANHLYVFQRSASHCIPKFGNEPLSDTTRWILRNVPLIGPLIRLMAYWPRELIFYPQMYQKLVGNRKKMLTTMYEEYRDSVVKDEVIRNKITPTCEPFGKRLLLHNDYYPTLIRDNVTLIKGDIKEIKENSIVYIEDGNEYETKYELDCIIMGTGFKSQEFLGSIKEGVYGKNGINLQKQKWIGKDPKTNKIYNNAYAYLGCTIDEFPNLFMLYGPGTNLGHASVVFMIECSANYALQCIKYMILNNYNEMDTKHDVINKYNKWLDKQHTKLAWFHQTNNWYKNYNGRVPCNWGYSTPYYWFKTYKMNKNDYIWKKSNKS